MRLYGNLTELDELRFREDGQSIVLRPNASVTYSATQTLSLPEISAASDSLVSRTSPDTLTNKSLSDSTTFFVDNADATKKLQLQLSGLTTSTTRTVTIPDADTTMVGTDVTQTLTNKTLTLPKVNEAVDLTATATELNQLDGIIVGGTSAGDIVTLDDAQTLTNKTLTLPQVNEAVNLTATSTELNQLDGVAVGGTSAGDIVTLDDTQTLTNKSISGSTNTLSNVGYSSLVLTDSIVNADVNSAAAIAGTKISPSFGAQNLSAAQLSGTDNTLTLQSGTQTWVLGYVDVGSGRSYLTNSNNTGSTNNQINVGFGSITAGIPATVALTLDQSQNVTMPGYGAGILHSDSSGLLTSSAIVNADVDASAAIAYSKLNLSNSIVNADVNASAAIAYSKLNLSDSILNADINSAAAIAYSKLNLSLSIVNGDVSTSAAIARSKLAAGTASHVVINDGSGNFSSEAQLAITRGGTGAATASAGFDALSPTTTAEDLIVYRGGTNVRLPVGLEGEVLKVIGGVLDYGTGGGDVTSSASILDNSLVRGDGGAKGVQDSGITVTDDDILEDVGGVVVTDATSASLTVDAGTTLQHFILTVSNTHTYTINGSLVSHLVTVASGGTLTVNGTSYVI